jgi:hypothetical protein
MEALFEFNGKYFNPMLCKRVVWGKGRRRVYKFYNGQEDTHPYKVRLYKAWYNKQPFYKQPFINENKFDDAGWSNATVTLITSDGQQYHIECKSNDEAEALHKKYEKSLDKCLHTFKPSV